MSAKELSQTLVTAMPDGWTGEVFVEVMSGVQRDWHDLDRGRVVQAFPALRVTTYRDQARETSAGVKYRGRTYHVDEVEIFMDGGHGANPDGWIGDHRTHYSKGFRNESGSPVDWKSPMRARLRDLTRVVRDAYVAEHPEWARESLASRLRDLIALEETQSAKRRGEADAHDKTAASLRAELEALTGSEG